MPFFDFGMQVAVPFENGDINAECPCSKWARIGTKWMEIEVVDDF